MLSTLAMLTVGCLIDGAIVALLAYLIDGRRAARLLYGTQYVRARGSPFVRATYALRRRSAREGVTCSGSLPL